MDVVFRNVDADTLAAIIKLIGPDKAELVAPEWTIERATAFLRDLSPRPRNLILDTAAAGGHLPASSVLNSESATTLRGLTGPVTKAMMRLAAGGVLPEGLPTPVATSRGARAFVMPPHLVDAFAAAGKIVAADRL
ncbi:hypothetical protein N806_31975 [Rhodococcus sp. P27]|nr:hypothetical protein N806_31975 [Rhodococcus sp. P27]